MRRIRRHEARRSVPGDLRRDLARLAFVPRRIVGTHIRFPHRPQSRTDPSVAASAASGADGRARRDAASAPHPDANIYRQQQRATLEAAVARLPVALAQVLTLTLEGLSQREIADVLGITENNVAVRANRARSRVKTMLAVPSGESHE